MRIELKTLDGIVLYEEKIIDIIIEFSRFTPSVILILTIPMHENAKNYNTVKIFYKNKIIFEGQIKRQEEIESTNGRTIKIKALNVPSEMLLNQPLPSDRTYITNEILLSKYIAQFGMDRIAFNKSTSIYTKVRKGINYWDFLNNCCINMYSKPCYMNGDKEVVLEPFTNDKHIISILNDNLKPIEIKKYYNRERAISKLNTINGKRPNGDYNYFVTENEEAKKRGIKKEIYWNVNRDIISQIASSEKKIKDSNIDLIRFDIVLFGIQGISVGDSVSLIYDNTYNNLYVAELSYIANTKFGLITNISLYDKQFIK